MSNKESHNWDLVIASKTKLIEFNFEQLWHYRDLLYLLIKRDIISFYKQTILGPLWFFIQPIFTTIIYTFIFGGLAKISTDGIPQPLFYMAGITAWNYFSECLVKTSTVFKDNANIFGKVYFPRLILPLSIVGSNLVRFGVQFLLFIIFILYYYIKGFYFEISWAILFFPFLVLLMALLGLGLGLIITAMTIKYRDLAFLIVFGVQLLMYTTTVIYPLSAAPIKYKLLISLNPMTGIIEAFRYSILGKGEFTTSSILYSTLITILTLFIGMIVFNKTEKTFLDTV